MWEVDIAKVIQGGKKQHGTDIIIGRVMIVSPIKISIYEGQAILQERDIIYTMSARRIELIKGMGIILIPLISGKYLFLDTEG